MTDSTPPRTLRDQIAKICAWPWPPGTPPPHPFSDVVPTPKDYDAADVLLASFDIRPHNEPADEHDVAVKELVALLTRVRSQEIPEGMTAEKLRAIAAVLKSSWDGPPRGSAKQEWVAAASWLREWADALAARDVGGDSPAGNKETRE